MEKIYKILVMILIVITLVVVAVLPSGVAFADQTCKTNKVSLFSCNATAYPLKNGFVISTHMNGPVYFEKKEFQLHGAKSNAHFELWREITENVNIPGTTIVVIPAGTLLKAEGDFWTDKHGNGHITTNQSPSAPSFIKFKPTGINHLTFKNVLFEEVEGGEPVRAYESEILTTYIDYKWTPDPPTP